MYKGLKYIVILLSAAIPLLSGCGTTRSSAILGGAAIGSNLGGTIGGLIGDSRHGWRGGYRGSAIGSIVGTVAGAAIGNAVTAPHRSKTDDEMYLETPPRKAGSPAFPQPSFEYLQIRRIRFIDDNRDHIISPNESSKIIFEIINEGNEPAYNVVPCIRETSGNKHIHISPSVMVEQLLPHDGIKYTATVSAGKRLKSGTVTFRLSVTDTYGQEYAYQEFTLDTQR